MLLPEGNLPSQMSLWYTDFFQTENNQTQKTQEDTLTLPITTTTFS